MHTRGFTLIEFVVVVIVIGIVAGFALDRLLPLIGRAERIAFVQVRAQLQSALLLEAAERITRGETATLGALADGNPMTLLLEPPVNYRGAYAALDGALERGSWYFDNGRSRLVYRVGKHADFETLDGPPGVVELRVQFVYDDRDADGDYDAGRDTFEGLRLAETTAYRWAE
jgi:general secretion pathway protein G